MQFQFPQFIETKTKIIGPFTMVQFLWLAGGGVIIYLLRFVLNTTLLFIVGIPIAGLSVGLSFLKIEGVPFPQYLLMALGFALGKKKYLYEKEDNNVADDVPILNVKRDPFENLGK